MVSVIGLDDVAVPNWFAVRRYAQTQRRRGLVERLEDEILHDLV